MKNPWGESYGSRLMWAREQTTPVIAQSELGRRCGVTPQTIQYLENAANNAKGSSHTNAFARELGVDAHWLATGQGNPGLLATEPKSFYGPVTPVLGMSPLLSWIRAGELCATQAGFTPEDAEDWLPCPVPFKPEIYALIVAGSSMDDGTPEGYPDGITVFFDPTAQPQHNDDVVVLTPDGKATFKRIQHTPEGMKLIALNPGWTKRIIDVPPGTKICAVAVFAGRKKRR